MGFSSYRWDFIVIDIDWIFQLYCRWDFPKPQKKNTFVVSGFSRDDDFIGSGGRSSAEGEDQGGMG